MLFQKFFYQVQRLAAVEAAAAMAGSQEFYHLHILSQLFHPVIQPAALVKRYEHIAAAMHDQKRRRRPPGGEIAQGRGGVRQLPVFQHVLFPDQTSLRAVRGGVILNARIVVHHHDIGRRVPVHNAPHGCAYPVRIVSVRRIISGKSGQERGVSAAGISPECHAVFIDPVFGGVFFQKTDGGFDTSQINSGFEMKISAGLAVLGGKIPLALPVEKYTEPTYYVESNWNPHTYVPYLDSRPIHSRTLPDDGSAYPYVTVSDFLEDTIVRIPYKLNSECFFDGNDSNSSAEGSFLLPLKKTFFDYFT